MVSMGGWQTGVAFALIEGHSGGLRYAERFETPLWPVRSAFYYFLLLPPAAVSGNGSRKKLVPESTGGSPEHISVPADWVRPHAGARAFAGQRAGERQCVAGVAGTETARITRDAGKEEARFGRPAFLTPRKKQIQNYFGVLRSGHTPRWIDGGSADWRAGHWGQPACELDVYEERRAATYCIS
jgi:hypothetical protein